MEKVIYALWRNENDSKTAFNARLQGEIADRLLKTKGVRGLRLNLMDADVNRAEALRQVATKPQMDAVVQVWLDVSHGEFRAPVDAILRDAAQRIAAWLVTESAVIPNTLHPSVEGQRTYGWSQFCFLQKPDRLSREEWLHNWQGLHTPVAIDTQSNFEYIQNLVTKPLIEGPYPYAALVEECFPTDAMDHPDVFFDAPGDPAMFKKNADLMAESCARFIDFDRIDALPTSQYEIRKIVR